jgi:hypothetical protein
MPVVETMVLEITCDNPDCPGNTLDPTSRTGWIFISHEVYGQPSSSSVFCSSECVSAYALAAADDPDNLFPVPKPPEPEPIPAPVEPVLEPIPAPVEPISEPVP